MTGVYRTEPAPLASSANDLDGIDFQKFAVPGALLELAQREPSASGVGLQIVTDCVVERIVQQYGRATALQTSRGVLALGDAKLVLGMGTLPPTTLVRNAFPEAEHVGERFSSHFITSIVARVPKADLEQDEAFGDLELGACYVAGIGKDFEQQYHIQLSALWDVDPEKNAGTALRYMPDVVATASMEQLRTSRGYVIFVCAVLGELDYRNPDNFFLGNPADHNPITNSFLQVTQNQSDWETWDAMDKATYEVLETVLSPKGASRVEYWHGDPNQGSWQAGRPSQEQVRVDAMVHESSTLHIGDQADTAAPVGLDYRLRASQNVYITGGALWPQGGSWNPTMTMVALAQDLADQLV